MAAPNTNTDLGFNQWGTISVQIPDYLADTRERINTTAEFLVSVLDVTLTALEFAKTFLVGYLDPIAAIVAAIVAEVNGILADLRQIGMYITGDWGKFLEYPFHQLEGGFQEYQRRMIARLTDMTDPSRPDVSAHTKVLSMFFYLSVDVSEILRLIKFIQMMAKFFQQSYPHGGSLPIATLTPVKYGADAVDVLHPKSLAAQLQTSPQPPAVAKLSWTLSSTSTKSPFNPFPPIPPGGFVVTVSTLEKGLKLMFDCPKSDTSMDTSVKDPANQVQPREYGQVRLAETGEPLILFGGAGIIPPINLGENSYNSSLDSKGNVKNGKTRIYAQKVAGDDGVIPLELLKAPDSKGVLRYLLQQTFYVPSAEKWASWASGDYGYVLNAADMPYTCTWKHNTDGTITPENIEPATTFYVQVASCSKEAYDTKLQYQFLPPNARGGQPYVEGSLGSNAGGVGAWSKPVRVTFPSVNTKAYLDALKTALLVLVLSRPDLTVYDPNDLSYADSYHKKIAAGRDVIPQNALLATGLEPMRHLADMVLSNYRQEIEKKNIQPMVFRKTLMDHINRAATNIYNMTGSNAQIEKIVVDQTHLLRTVTWGTIFNATHPEKKLFDNAPFVAPSTLLDSINPDKEGCVQDTGISSNPYCIGHTESVVKEWFYVQGFIQDRKPQMMEMVEGGHVAGNGISTQMVVPVELGVGTFRNGLNPGMRAFYEQFQQADGGIVVDPKYQYQDQLNSLASRSLITGSADLSPVFYLRSHIMDTITSASPVGGSANAGIFYCRGLLTKFNDGQLVHEAEVALSLAASAIRRSPNDGPWIALRLLDVFPSLEDFFATIKNWLNAVSKSIQSIVDTIKKYIAFIEARVADLQNLIRKINDILQNLLGWAFQIPKCSFLALVSDGTQGVVGDLVNAKTKPSDSPLAYGAGIAVVIPFGPSFAMELIQDLLKGQAGTPDSGTLMTVVPPTAIGIEGLPTPTISTEDVPPDTL